MTHYVWYTESEKQEKLDIRFEATSESSNLNCTNSVVRRFDSLVTLHRRTSTNPAQQRSPGTWLADSAESTPLTHARWGGMKTRTECPAEVEHFSRSARQARLGERNTIPFFLNWFTSQMSLKWVVAPPDYPGLLRRISKPSWGCRATGIARRPLETKCSQLISEGSRPAEYTYPPPRDGPANLHKNADQKKYGIDKWRRPEKSETIRKDVPRKG